MSFWTRGNVRRVSGGSWMARGRTPESAGDGVLQGLSIDTRTIRRGQAFLALRGERFDGHAFVSAAAAAGAALIIIDDETAGRALVAQAGPAAELCVLRVPDTRRALLKLAAAYRQSLERTRVVGVVGSNGKTTAARLIASVLVAGGWRGTASPKSFNNAVGVPLTILSASPADQFLVCEIGTNAPGEIDELAQIVQPDIAVITSIGREHLQGFGSIEGVAREEASILRHLAPSALVVAPAQTPGGSEVLHDLLRGVANAGSPPGAINIVRFGFGGDADLRADDVRHEAGRLVFTINGRLHASMPMLGRHNALNALAAFAVGRRFGLDEPKIIEGLAAATGPAMRLEPVRVSTPESVPAGPIIYINDAYNANPDSMLASLATFEDVMHDWPGVTRRVLVLGDMLELGDASEPSHREIGRRVRAMSDIDLVLLLGPLMEHAAQELQAAAGAPLTIHDPALDDSAILRLSRRLAPGDLVLLKGSRGTRLERVIQARQHDSVSPIASPVTCPGVQTGAGGAATITNAAKRSH